MISRIKMSLEIDRIKFKTCRSCKEYREDVMPRYLITSYSTQLCLDCFGEGVKAMNPKLFESNEKDKIIAEQSASIALLDEAFIYLSNEYGECVMEIDRLKDELECAHRCLEKRGGDD